MSYGMKAGANETRAYSTGLSNADAPDTRDATFGTSWRLAKASSRGEDRGMSMARLVDGGRERRLAADGTGHTLAMEVE